MNLIDFSVPRNSHYILKVDNIVMDLDFRITDENQVVSHHNSPAKISGFIHVLIPKNHKEKNYTLSVKPKYSTKLKYKPKIEIEMIEQKIDVDFYKLINIVTKTWYASEKGYKNKMFLLLEGMDNTNLSLNQKLELIIYKLSILNAMNKHNEILDEINQVEVGDIKKTEYLVPIMWYKAISLLDKNEYNNSIKVFQEILADEIINYKSTVSWKLIIAKIRLYFGLTQSVKYYFDNNNFNDGYKSISTAIDTIALYQDRQLTAESFYLLGAYYSAKQNWKESLSILNLAQKYSLEINYFDNMVGIYNQKAIAYYNLNLLDKSLKNYRLAIKTVKRLHLSEEHYYFLYGVARVYKDLGNNIEAKRYYKKYLDYSSKEYKPHSYNAINQLGVIARKTGDYNQSIILHERVKDFYTNNKENQYINILTELSMDYLEANESNKSELFALLVIVLTNINNFDSSELKQLGITEEMSFWSKNNVLHNTLIHDLRLVFSSPNIKFESKNTIKSLKTLVRLAISKQEFNQDQIEFIFMNIGKQLNLLPINHQLEFYQLKIKFLIKINKYDDIDITALNALTLINNTRKKFHVSDLALHWTNQAKSILDKYIDALSVQKKYMEIFEILEKYYAINLREKRQDTTNDIIKQKSEKIQKALDSYVSLERETLLSNNSETQNQADEAKEHFLALKIDDEQIIEKVELDYLSIEQVQEKLDDKELFLRYYINDKQAFVFIIDKGSYEVKKLPNKSKLHQTVKSIIGNIKSKRFNNLTTQDELFEQILPHDKINSGLYNKIIIIPDGILNLLPFASINISPVAGQYTPLVTEINIERTYSASDYFAQIDVPNNIDSISILSNPVYLQSINDSKLQSSIAKDNKLWEFTQLPYTELEAQYIQQSFPDATINLMNGVNATNENFLSEQTRNSNIIHIATHGFFNDKSLENVGIATTIIDADNNKAPGVLAMREILYQPFKANLAVVSGCETTLGKEINGEGFNSLSRGLLSQGVNSVIGTIWSISDRATPIFMREFYTNLKNMNGNVSKALNQSKISFATNPDFRRYRHPYYWAGFVLTSSNRGISENIF